VGTSFEVVGKSCEVVLEFRFGCDSNTSIAFRFMKEYCGISDTFMSPGAAAISLASTSVIPRTSRESFPIESDHVRKTTGKEHSEAI
jgi:hypothetical protein